MSSRLKSSKAPLMSIFAEYIWSNLPSHFGAKCCNARLGFLLQSFDTPLATETRTDLQPLVNLKRARMNPHMNKNACRIAQRDGRSPFEMAKKCIFPFYFSRKSYPSAAANGEKASSEVPHYMSERKHGFWGLVYHCEIVLSSFNSFTVRPNMEIRILGRVVRGYTPRWMFVGNQGVANHINA